MTDWSDPYIITWIKDNMEVRRQLYDSYLEALIDYENKRRRMVKENIIMGIINVILIAFTIYLYLTIIGVL